MHIDAIDFPNLSINPGKHPEDILLPGYRRGGVKGGNRSLLSNAGREGAGEEVSGGREETVQGDLLRGERPRIIAFAAGQIQGRPRRARTENTWQVGVHQVVLA